MSRLARALQIRPGEGRTAGLLVVLMLLVSAGGSIGGNGIDTLFFSRFGVRFLPQMYIALGGVMLVVALAVTVLLARVSRERLFVLMPLVLAGILVAERALVGVGPRWVYPVIWLAMNVIGSLQALLAWGLAGLVCDTRQAKRLFPLFGAGGILGAVVGGLGTPVLVRAINTENLLLVWAATLVGALVVAVSLTGLKLRAPERARPSRARKRKVSVLREMQHGYRTVRSSASLRWTAFGAAVFAVLLYSIAFPFSKAVTAQFGSEEDLAGFLGLFQGVSTGAAFLVSLLVANRLFKRFGVMRMVVAFPVIYLVGFAALTATSAFPLVVTFRFVQMVWLMGVFSSALQASFNVVSPARKDQVRIFMDGVPAQAGTVAAGVLLLVGQETLSPRALFGIGLLAAAVALPVAWRAMRAYSAALVDALREGRPQVFYADEQPFGGFQRDAAAVGAAVAGVTDPDRAIRRVSAEILGHLAVPEATAALVRALKDRDPPVRVAALRGLVRARATEAMLEVAARLHDPEAAVRREALDALRALAPYPAGLAHETRGLLADEDPIVRAFAAATLLRIGPDPDAAKLLRAMAADEDGAVRAAAITAAADAHHADTVGLVAAALKDPLVSVREAAAGALATFDPATTVSVLVEALGDDAPSVRRVAAESLAAAHEAALEPTLAALSTPGLALGALDALGRMPVVPAEPVAAFARAAGARALRYGELRRAAERAAGGDRTMLLAVVLRARAFEHAERALRGAGLLSDRAATAVAVENLASEDPAQRANALETLEAAGPRELVAPLLTLWEPEEGVAALDGEWLTDALADDDAWVRACAVAASGELDGGLPRETLERVAASDPDPFVVAEAHRMLAGDSMDTLPTLSVIERVVLLRRVPLFAGLSPDDLRRVAEIAAEESFDRDEVLAEEGDEGDQTYVIVSGEVGVVLGLGGPDEREVSRHGPGAHVGEMAVIQAGARSASLIARDDVRALCLDRLHFSSLLRERPDVGMALMRTLVERVRESNRLLPQDLAARAESGRARPAGERRVVTMLFCDVVGSTAMAERLDPEEWADIIEEALTALVEPIDRYGGTLARFMGDAVLAFFGAPTAHDDDAERAVRAGLEMVRAVSPLRGRLTARGLSFDVRVGINTGLVRTGDVGSDARIEYTALGDAVNLAARMEQAAAPGTIQISESTSRLVAPLFELEDLGTMEVKGKQEPVKAYRVVASKTRPGRVRGIEGLTSRVVGRDEEISTLSRAAAEARAGRGGVVSLVGEAGLGKSRLIEELRARWETEASGEPRWLETRAVSFDATRPYALAQQLVRALCGVRDMQPSGEARARVAAFTEEVGMAEPRQGRAAFEVILGIEDRGADGASPRAVPEGEELKRDVLAAARDACRAWASHGPGVVVLDDLHWSDPASLELVLHVLPVVAEAPVMFVCACRPEPVALPEQIASAVDALPERYTRIALDPLEAEETAALVAGLLELPDLPEELRSMVVSKTAGNPLFIEETLRALMDGGAVVRSNGGWRIAKTAEVSVPDHLQALLAARIDRIEPAPRRILQLASVIGSTFGYRVLRSICEDPDDLGDRLDQLERAGLIVETAEVPELEFGFRHPLLQEAAYRSILIRERREYHRQVAEALESSAERDPAGRADQTATLAHHFDEAGDVERARKYRTEAARRAARLFAHAEAITHFRRALELAREGSVIGPQLSELYRGLGLSLQLSGRHDLALAAYEEMEAAARSNSDRAMELAAVTAQATIRAIPSEAQDPNRALELLDRCLALAAELGDRAAEARAYWNRMLVIQFASLGIEEAVRNGERALAIARELHLEELTAYVLHDISDSYYFIGRSEDAEAARRESQSLFERLDNRTMLADSIAREGHIALVAGRYRDALPRLDEALEIDRQVDSVWGEAYGKCIRAPVYWELGDLGAALADLLRADELAGSASKLIQIGARSDLAVMLGELGAVDRGLARIRPALDEAPTAPGQEPWAYGAHARLLVLAGKVGEASSAHRAAREKLPPAGGLVHFHMARHVYLAGAEVALARGDAPAALEVLEELSVYMQGRRLGWGYGDVARLRARALLDLGRADEAWETLDTARRQLETADARWGLWRVLAAMSGLADQRGDADEIKDRAREVLRSVAGTLTDPELAASFAELPEVRSILEDR